jgi:8-oxo-dGTP pyrophosphatase MutT (NUDIX family)
MTDEITDLDLPGPWRGLREAVVAEKRVLSQSVFERIWQIFITQYAEGSCTPEDLTREYQREEFLLVVRETGQETGASPDTLQLYRDCLSNNPVFAKWFQETSLPGDQQVLLAARWLCHLIGLRHCTVEIFIDPPHLDGHTLVQVRGMDKYEAPGAFDIPCAGHVSGVDPVDVSLRKELAEELNLSVDDLIDLHPLRQYNSYSGDGGRGALNNEYRFLYRARLKASAAQKIGFIDGEVAGLAVFSVLELRVLVDRFPERVASGLSDAMVYYL